MRFYFSLTFALPEGEEQTIPALQAQLASVALTLEPARGAVREFTAHFSGEGDNATLGLEEARQAVEAVLEGVQMVGMDFLDTPIH
ncbi:hypothetical protein [Saccharospirillum mangrovi]|uniref:hypothetical protein n=1 Tax=Saccharospirillum mangrovi TaxID=2161747 RepID=UPI000D3C322A|nr:hypothetical protein [Saccharospirillum mangrovi]